MVPHIVFHVDDDGYFPGPDVWATGRPVADLRHHPARRRRLRGAAALRRAPPTGRAPPRAPARCCRRSTPGTAGSTRTATPSGEGLVAIIHPWESGRDNSIDWDEAFERVPTDGVEPYVRRDTQHADPAHRPTKAQYDRYLWLVQHFRGARLGQREAARRLAVPDRRPRLQRHPDPRLRRSRRPRRRARRAGARRGEPRARREGRSRRWSGSGASAHGQYLCLDRATGELDRQRLDRRPAGRLRRRPARRAPRRSRATIERLAAGVAYIVPSHDPADPRFDSQALLARPGLARRQLHDRRRAGARRRDRGRRADPRSRASS